MSLPLPSPASSSAPCLPLRSPTLSALVFDEFGISEADAVFTAVEPHLVVEGVLRTREGHGLAVLGEVHGSIVSEGTVFIGPGATVRGPVTAAKLIVAGELIVTPLPADTESAESATTPAVVATTLLQIKRGGSVSAPRIAYGELEAERGSRLRGEMLSSDSASLLRRQAPRVVHGAFPGSLSGALSGAPSGAPAPAPASLLKPEPSREPATAARSPSPAVTAPSDLGVLPSPNPSARSAAPSREAEKPAVAPAAASLSAPTDLGPVPTDLGPVSFSGSLGPIPRADRTPS